MTNQPPLPFEEAYARLEAILETMNGNRVSLDDALKLYEEADQLMTQCSKRLADAEVRIETLIKNRDGALQLDAQGAPATESLASS